MSKPQVSKALREVWAWKDACYREVAHLPLRKALEKRLDDIDKRAADMGSTEAGTSRLPRVAESRGQYGKRSKRI